MSAERRLEILINLLIDKVYPSVIPICSEVQLNLQPSKSRDVQTKDTSIFFIFTVRVDVGKLDVSNCLHVDLIIMEPLLLAKVHYFLMQSQPKARTLLQSRVRKAQKLQLRQSFVLLYLQHAFRLPHNFVLSLNDFIIAIVRLLLCVSQLLESPRAKTLSIKSNSQFSRSGHF